MGLKPFLDLQVGGVSILDRMAGRNVSASVSDQAGSESDSLNFELDVGDMAVALPRKGQLVTVFMGYIDGQQRFMGAYTVDEVSLDGWPLLLSVSAKSADMRDSLKEHRTEAYENATLGEIIGKIGQRHNLKPAIGQDMAARKIPYIAQTEESDLHFLTRLSRAHGAVAAFKNNALIFTKRGAGLSASGLALPSLTITPKDCISPFTLQLPDRPQVKTVQGQFYDRQKAKRRKLEAKGQGQEASFTLRSLYSSQEEAQWAAEGKADDMARAAGSLSLTLPGRPEIAAEMMITASGFYPGTDNTWAVKTATHTIDGSSFITELTCELQSAQSPADEE